MAKLPASWKIGSRVHLAMEEAKEEERLEEGKHKGEEEEKEASSEEKNGDTEHKKKEKEKKKKKGKKKDKKKKKNKKKEAFDILATLSEEQKDLLIQFKKRLGLLPRDEDDDGIFPPRFF